MNIPVLKFIQFATDNNEKAIAESMFAEKVIVAKGEDIKARLYKLFVKDRLKFIKVMRKAGFNSNANNYTTSQSVLSALKATEGAYRKKNGIEDGSVIMGRENSVGAKWYDSVLDTLVGGSTGSSNTITTIESPASGSQTKIIVVSIVAIGGIIALLYFLNK